MFNKFKTYHLTQGTILLAIAIFTGLLYANTVKSHFSGYDITVIRGNETISSFSNISRIFSEEFAKGYGVRQRFYRPLEIVGYMLEYSLWRLEAEGYHIVNIGLHILAVFGLFWLIKLLFGNTAFAAITAFLFGIHPIHAQTVMTLNSQGSLLAAVLLLASFIGYIKATLDEDRADYLLCLLCYIAALFSYEASVIFPLLLLSYHFFLKRRLLFRYFMAIVFFSIAYLILRIWIFPKDFYGPYQDTAWFFASTVDYLRYLLLPFGFYREYQPSAGLSLFNYQVLLGIAFYGLTFIYLIKRRRDSAISTCFVMWFCVGLLPYFASLLFSPFNTSGWLYLASMGFFVIFVRSLLYFLYDKKNNPTLAIIAVVLLACLYTYSTFCQIQYLKNPQKYYEAEITLS